MAILAPTYRPAVKLPAQASPTNITLSGGADLRIEPSNLTVETPATGRVTVWEDDHAAGYNTGRHPYDFFTLHGSIGRSFTTMNGHGAVTVTWPEGASPSVRHGGVIQIPGGPYDEVWLTHDIRFEDNWVPGPEDDQGTQKIFALQPESVSGGGGGCPSSVWIYRYTPRNGLILESYNTHPTSGGLPDSESFLDQPLTRGEIYTIEMHWKKNSATGVFDGLGTTSINGEVVSTDGPFRWWCGDSGHAAAARCWGVRTLSFHGGNGSGWAPYQDSAYTLGHIKIEVPA